MASLLYAQRMSAYNRWMNERLLEACAGLSDEQRKRDLGAFFRSIHGTLNHLLIADRFWLSRFTAAPPPVGGLGEERYADYAELRAERALTDTAIARWVDGLTPEDFARELVYTSVTLPQQMQSRPFWLAVVHFFNHQTHHRGQLTTLLMQSGIDPGVTDLTAMPTPSAA